MKLTHENIFTTSIIIGFTGLLYSYMDLHRKVKNHEDNINLIMSTHVSYMVVKDEHIKEIKSINKTLEDIALTTPFRGEGWQSKFIRDKIKRDLEHHYSDGYSDKLYDDCKNMKFYDDEPLEEGV